jgi:aminoglycoside phosphotransferase (APT) family kinase protein
LSSHTTGSSSAASGLVPEPVGCRLADVTGHRAWLSASAQLIAGGKSNLTYELRSEAGAVILRRPPTGTLLPSAHDMNREVRVQRALHGGPVPVARILVWDADGEDLGVPYYVMEKVEGQVVRDSFPPDLAPLPADRTAISRALVDTLSALHSIDPEAAGLGDFGRPAGFMRRQVSRWTDQWHRSRTHDVPEVEALGRRLREFSFPEGDAAILHGDFRLDNCLLNRELTDPIAAVLDWELSTLGDPLADLGMLLFYWCQAGEPPPVLTPAISATDGFPSRAEIAERYFASSRSTGSDLFMYVAFAHFKFAVIAQGIAQRGRAGDMAGQDFGDLDEEVRRIATQGLDRLTRKEI